MAYETGLATLFRGSQDREQGFKNLHAFALLNRACNVDLLLDGINGILACAIHEEYIRLQERAGKTPESNPSMVPWERLPESIKESNRHQADHIGIAICGECGRCLYMKPIPQLDQRLRIKQ